ncbi:MAG: glycosyltransferase [Acidimicrobiales bacterium]
MSIDLSIVIPAYNEAARLANGFERFRRAQDQLDMARTEVIVIDDGSTDETLRVAHEVYGHLPETLFVQQPQNLGKGAAVRLGIGLSRGANVIAADADMAIDPVHFPEIVAALSTSPLAPGSRTSNGRISYESALRTVAGGVFHQLVRHYAKTHVRDTQCGCKGFQRGPARLLALLGMIDGFAYDAEMFFLAEELGLAVHPVPVEWDDVSGSSVKVSRVSITMLGDLRALRKTTYENPVVEFESTVDRAAIANAARQARIQGLVVASNDVNALLVLPRDGALAGLTISQQLGGTLRTAELAELRARRYEAV